MTRRFRRNGDATGVVVVDRIRAVEVPVLTEAKRYVVRGDAGAALRYAYPKVVEDLGRAFGTALPEGYSHEELLERSFTPEMAPLVDFFQRLYTLYAPARFGEGAPPEAGDEALELLQSLYSAEPMWRLYVIPENGAKVAPASPPTLPPDLPVEEESPWPT
jgi:hypothetical protein